MIDHWTPPDEIAANDRLEAAQKRKATRKARLALREQLVVVTAERDELRATLARVAAARDDIGLRVATDEGHYVYTLVSDALSKAGV